tara:strand:- start:318 stop:488 length:171 start_codon:yes stop_codon:yes gene_type:complete
MPNIYNRSVVKTELGISIAPAPDEGIPLPILLKKSVGYNGARAISSSGTGSSSGPV